ncbi:unnamed protein product [Clonostachys chloroleuca]|uniref:Zn(2)-C6 fungal-type domain-containing protein n=1 Tax=Clonostachys chloroleuca TaxID=1926264 RepID=A0AA35M167_9HYPO|nr:unnamed protein product [Clonostachys chloroleuca]
MVRTTIACSHCRKLKIKCVHEGSPPCQNCKKKDRTRSGECLLTGPELKRKRVPDTPSGDIDQTRRNIRSTLADTPSTQSSELQVSVNGNPNGGFAVDSSTIIAALKTFSSKFPEFRFVHLPTLSKFIHSIEENGRIKFLQRTCSESSSIHMLCASIVALCLPITHELSHASPPEAFASFARGCVSIASPPDLSTVQALLALSMYEWGTGNGYRAWMYSGTATRMMQSLRVMVQVTSLAAVDKEIHNRTLWACFIMDRLVHCGKTQPFALSAYSMDTHWPTSEDDFAFGESSGHAALTNEERGPLENMEGDMNHYYGILVRGFDIWARILSWVVSGGRRLPGMSLPENHPWVAGSRWKLLYDELMAWRDRQEKRLRYPEASVEGNSALGTAERFAYLNLIYYVSLLFLGREYLRFIPTPDSEPNGPVDPPLLPLPAPPGWWQDRADEIFTSAAHIASLLRKLEEANEPLYTPFPGFCAFSAATMNLYVSSFPKMNLDRHHILMYGVNKNIEFLHKFKDMWAMGKGWWVTIGHCKQLYNSARQDHSQFRGRTREDYSALEYSIHDIRGQPPTIGDCMSPEISVEDIEITSTTNNETAAALSLQELSGFDNTQQTSVTLDDAAANRDWNQTWPLWGEQDFIPFAIEGVPFDYNMSLGDL